MKHKDKDIRYLLNKNAEMLIEKPELRDIVNNNALCHDVQRIIDDEEISMKNYINMRRYYRKVKDLAEDYLVRDEEMPKTIRKTLERDNHYHDIQHTMAYLMDIKTTDFRHWKGHDIFDQGSMAAMILILCYNIQRKIGAS